jgi:hypothetical protein
MGPQTNISITQSALTDLFQSYQSLETPPIIELQNIDKKPVGALYLNKIRYKDLIVSETNNSEKYYLYIDGVGIYFSFFRKINP